MDKNFGTEESMHGGKKLKYMSNAERMALSMHDFNKLKAEEAADSTNEVKYGFAPPPRDRPLAQLGGDCGYYRYYLQAMNRVDEMGDEDKTTLPTFDSMSQQLDKFALNNVDWKLAVLDVDNFKCYNNAPNTYASADKHLKKLGIKVKAIAKGFGGDSLGDFIRPAHMHGDEFLVKFNTN